MKEYILENGIKMITCNMTNTHSVSVSLVVKAGAVYENENENGITHFLEHLHFRELSNMSQKDLYYAMESIGSSLRATTYMDFMRFSMKIHPDFICECLDIFCRLIEIKAWSASEFEKEKRVVINQIHEDEYYNYFSSVKNNLLFGEQKSIMGKAETIATFTPKQLSEYKERVFTKGNILLCVFGNTDDECLNECIADISKIQLQDLCPNKPPIDYKNRFHRKPDVLFNKTDDEFVDIDIYFDIDKNLSVESINILNCILGGGVGSRLQLSIREELSYTSCVYSEIESFCEFSELHIGMSVNKLLIIKCIDKVINILNDMKNNITKRDLDVSLPFYTKNIVFDEDDPDNKSFMQAYHLFVLNEDTHGNYCNITEALIEDTCKRIFRAENTGIIISGDCNSISISKIHKIIKRLGG